MVATKLILRKLACTINANAVRGCSYDFFLHENFKYHTKVSLHEIFQIYGSYYSYNNGLLAMQINPCPC